MFWNFFFEKENKTKKKKTKREKRHSIRKRELVLSNKTSKM